MLINGHPFTILGVAPENFDSAIGGYRPGVFIPISMVDVAMPWMAPRDDLNNHQSLWLTLVARLKPGVTRSQAEASLEPLWHSLRAYELTLYKKQTPAIQEELPRQFAPQGARRFRRVRAGAHRLKTPLIILMSMAGLLVAMCAINVATLLLLRAAGRAREMSMRYALGAKRGRIISQLLVEGGLLGIAGGAAGLALAPLVATTLVRLMTSADPGREPYSTSIDTRVLLFTLAISIVSEPALQCRACLSFSASRPGPGVAPESGTANRASQRFRKIAVGAQIALSVLLLGGAGLFVRTLDNLRSQPVGFETSNLASSASIPPPPAMAKTAPRKSSLTRSTPCAAFPASPMPPPPPTPSSAETPTAPASPCRATSLLKMNA